MLCARLVRGMGTAGMERGPFFKGFNVEEEEDTHRTPEQRKCCRGRMTEPQGPRVHLGAWTILRGSRGTGAVDATGHWHCG